MATVPPAYWGYLVNADKNPSLIFEQLLVSIANYIVPIPSHLGLPEPELTFLAAFYRLVGGDYDPLFLETPKPSLSFIYQSMGCFHTLQPEKDPYLAPDIPTLTIQGFIRFQTIQLLLEPDLHASFLQNAVKRLDLVNPADGLPFPDRLPRHALPSRPDPEVVTWHGGVAENLRLESNAAESRGPPTRSLPQISGTATDDSTAAYGSRQSVTDAVSRSRPHFRPPPSIKVPQPVDSVPIETPRDTHPWDLQRRRSSTSNLHSPTALPLPGLGAAPNLFQPPLHLDRSRPRSPSISSTSSISSSSSSSLSTSSVSLSPKLHPGSRHLSENQYRRQTHHRSSYHHERRHSSHGPYSPREATYDPSMRARLPARENRPSQHPLGHSPLSSTDPSLRLVDRVDDSEILTMVHLHSLFLSIVVSLSSLAIAAVPPDNLSLLQSVEQPAAPPGTALNVTVKEIKFNVPNTDTIITFSGWGKLGYQTDLHLCLLEGMGDLAHTALRSDKGDKGIIGGKFRKSYGQAIVNLESYSPPAFRLTISVVVDTLRGLGLFMSLYGYHEFKLDIHHKKLGHVGTGVVQFYRPASRTG
ncbi:MAG: hypothetical protein Q9168_003061 [Polycauliona sp. 1 TL-2023]